MNNADAKNLVRTIIGYVALALALIAFFKMGGWFPAIGNLAPGDVVQNATVAFALATTRSVV